KEYYWSGIFGSPDEPGFVITGLNPALTYNLKIAGSSSFRQGTITNNGTTIYKVNNRTNSLYVDNNTDQLATVFDVQPSTEGTIEISLEKGPGAPAVYINALLVELPEDMLYAPVKALVNYTVATGVQLGWQDNNTDETGYEIHRLNETQGSIYTLLTTLGANSTSYADQSIVQGNSYQYKIRAKRNNSTSL